MTAERFHGHSHTWEGKDIDDIDDRFGYLSSEDERKAWAPELEALAEQVSEVHVLTDDCYRDSAQRNAPLRAGARRRPGARRAAASQEPENGPK